MANRFDEMVKIARESLEAGEQARFYISGPGWLGIKKVDYDRDADLVILTLVTDAVATFPSRLLQGVETSLGL